MRDAFDPILFGIAAVSRALHRPDHTLRRPASRKRVDCEATVPGASSKAPGCSRQPVTVHRTASSGLNYTVPGTVREGRRALDPGGRKQYRFRTNAEG